MFGIVKFTVVLWVFVNFSDGNCSNILVVLPSPGYSQYLLAEPLVVALGQRGHHVTVISCFQTHNAENVKNVVVEYNLSDIMSSGKYKNYSIDTVPTFEI